MCCKYRLSLPDPTIRCQVDVSDLASAPPQACAMASSCDQSVLQSWNWARALSSGRSRSISTMPVHSFDASSFMAMWWASGKGGWDVRTDLPHVAVLRICAFLCYSQLPPLLSTCCTTLCLYAGVGGYGFCVCHECYEERWFNEEDRTSHLGIHPLRDVETRDTSRHLIRCVSDSDTDDAESDCFDQMGSDTSASDRPASLMAQEELDHELEMMLAHEFGDLHLGPEDPEPAEPVEPEPKKMRVFMVMSMF